MINRFIYYLTMFRSKRVIIQEYGKEFWCGFKDTSDKLFKLVLKDTPDIGKTEEQQDIMEYLSEFNAYEEISVKGKNL